MTTLAIAVDADDELWTLDNLPTPEAPYVEVGSELVEVRSRFPSSYYTLTGETLPPRIRVRRGIAGTTKASHIQGSTLTPNYGLGGGAGGGAIAVTGGGVTVEDVTELDLGSAPVSDAGGGVAAVAQATLAQTVTLTDSQIKALPGTGVVIVAAPGADKIILPFMALASFRWVADYTGIAGDATMHFAPDGLGGLLESSSAVSSFLAGGDVMLARWVQKADGATFDEASYLFPDGYVNQSLRMLAFNGGGSPSFTGGDAANEMVVTVLYTILDA